MSSIELMPCQMCGEKPYPPEEEFPYVECSNDNCWMSGPRHSKVENASMIWNRMQALIARGKLLDETAPTKTKKGGRL